jgi:hypothetical protein
MISPDFGSAAEIRQIVLPDMPSFSIADVFMSFQIALSSAALPPAASIFTLPSFSHHDAGAFSIRQRHFIAAAAGIFVTRPLPLFSREAFEIFDAAEATYFRISAACLRRGFHIFMPRR